MASKFTVFQDADYGFVVADADVKALSFAMVPVGHQWSYTTREDALVQAERLSGRNQLTRMIETPDRFEAAADTVYGAAW